ncbi:MAG: transcriptional regulator, TetR family [Actinomycetia bacterium]|nr:transcriptional regulator, TetR family [Actinomycetes bacterium]
MRLADGAAPPARGPVPDDELSRAGAYDAPAMPRAQPDTPAAPRRSALQQRRSRDTRRKLIRTALELWNERGFEAAFEETTAEEIARAAGVSKGTFYFHFAHKEDILLEMPWATAEIMIEEVELAIQRGEASFELVERLMTSLARRVSRAPRAAVLRVTGHWSRLTHNGTLPETPRGFGEAFDTVLRYACDRGELPSDIDVDELASLLQAATMDALVRWAATTQSPTALRAALSRRADVILRGAAVSYGP